MRWNPLEFDGFRHGYAGTIYRGQGQTLDATYVLHSVHWRAPAAYVALTRQRESIKLFVAESIAPNERELAEQMGRKEERGASLRWEDNREEAIRKMVQIGREEQAAARGGGRGAPGPGESGSTPSTGRGGPRPSSVCSAGSSSLLLEQGQPLLGPLGQGLANSVGMAMAERAGLALAASFALIATIPMFLSA